MKSEKIRRLRQQSRRAKAPGKRVERSRPIVVRFLIVCEGTQTEPNYFRSLIHNPRQSEICDVKVCGEGRGTCSLVRTALTKRDRLEHQNDMTFDRVWVVFDKDSFADFNQAISLAHKQGMKCAWTNEAFELWFCLHFEFINTRISRSDYIKKLEHFVRKKSGNSAFQYEKNSAGIYALLQEYGQEESAKEFARKLRQSYLGSDYAQHNPCTTVDLLVDELEHPESLLR